MEGVKSDTGMLFAAQIESMESRLHYEMEQVLFTDEPIECWTYPLIQPKLLEEAKKEKRDLNGIPCFIKSFRHCEKTHSVFFCGIFPRNRKTMSRKVEFT